MDASVMMMQRRSQPRLSSSDWLRAKELATIYTSPDFPSLLASRTVEAGTDSLYMSTPTQHATTETVSTLPDVAHSTVPDVAHMSTSTEVLAASTAEIATETVSTLPDVAHMSTSTVSTLPDVAHMSTSTEVVFAASTVEIATETVSTLPDVAHMSTSTDDLASSTAETASETVSTPPDVPHMPTPAEKPACSTVVETAREAATLPDVTHMPTPKEEPASSTVVETATETVTHPLATTDDLPPLATLGATTTAATSAVAASRDTTTTSSEEPSTHVTSTPDVFPLPASRRGSLDGALYQKSAMLTSNYIDKCLQGTEEFDWHTVPLNSSSEYALGDLVETMLKCNTALVEKVCPWLPPALLAPREASLLQEEIVLGLPGPPPSDDHSGYRGQIVLLSHFVRSALEHNCVSVTVDVGGLELAPTLFEISSSCGVEVGTAEQLNTLLYLSSIDAAEVAGSITSLALSGSFETESLKELAKALPRLRNIQHLKIGSSDASPCTRLQESKVELTSPSASVVTLLSYLTNFDTIQLTGLRKKALKTFIKTFVGHSSLRSLTLIACAGLTEDNGPLLAATISTIPSLEYICLKDCQGVGDNTLQSIALRASNALKTCKLQNLDGLTDDSGPSLKTLALQTTVSTLDLECCDFIDVNCAKALAVALTSGGCLTSLDISCCSSFTDRAGACLSTALKSNKQLKSLDFAWCQLIGDETCFALVESLSVNRSLEHLDLSWCQAITKKGGAAFSKIFRTNSTLTSLNLQHCVDMVDGNAHEFRNALAHNETLLRVDLIGTELGLLSRGL